MSFDSDGIRIVLDDGNNIPVENQASLDEFAVVEQDKTALRQRVIYDFSIQDYLCRHFEIQTINLYFSAIEDVHFRLINLEA